MASSREPGLLGETFTCLICSQNGLTEEQMKTHVLLEHIECNVCCPFCDLSGITSDEMNLHINAVHFEDLMSPTELSDGKGTVPQINNICKLSDKEFGGARPKSIKSGLKHSQSLDHSAAPLPESPKRKNMKSSLSETNLNSRSKLQLNFTSVLNPGPSLRSASMHSDINRVCETDEQELKPGNGLKPGSTSRGMKHDRSLDSNLRQVLETDMDIEETETLPTPPAEPARMEAPVNERAIVVPDINQNVEPDINSNIPAEFSCPLCQYITWSENLIQSHVNIAHVDILSPDNAETDITMSENNTATNGTTLPKDEYPCPICLKIYYNSGELSLHVNSQHANIFSPDKAEKMDIPKTEVDIIEFVCPVCEKIFTERFRLQAHVNGHFSAEQTPVHEHSDKQIAIELELKEKEAINKEQKEFQQLQAMYGMVDGTPYKKQYEKNLERAVAKGDMTVIEYHEKKIGFRRADSRGVDDGNSCTRGVIQKLQGYYKTSPHGVARSWLCTTVDHYAGSYGDKGWGCGYRNFQMLLSSLATEPVYNKVLFNGDPAIPSITKIQQMIEAAWEMGFDKQGSEQLGGRVYNTTKWIGATEIVATLASLKVKCKLLDFHHPTGPQGTHTKLFEWVKSYFEKSASFKPPLYLQHQGHSRTIVGIEELRDKSLRLLIFDPSTSKKQINLFNSFINTNIMRILRRTLTGLKSKQYQIVAVEGIIRETELNLLAEIDHLGTPLKVVVESVETSSDRDLQLMMEDYKVLKSERIS